MNLDRKGMEAFLVKYRSPSMSSEETTLLHDAQYRRSLQLAHESVRERLENLWPRTVHDLAFGRARAFWYTITEAGYQCLCGFSQFLDSKCDCLKCKELKAQLPLQNCPDCGRKFIFE